MEEYLQVKTGALGQLLASSRLFARVRDGDAGDARAAQHRQGLGAGAAPAPDARRRRPTTSSSSTRPPTGHGVGILRTPQHVRRDRPGRSDRPPGPQDRRDDRRSRVHGRGRRHDRRGDAGQRDAVRCATRCAPTSSALDAVIVNARYPERFSDDEVTAARRGARAHRRRGSPARRSARRCQSTRAPTPNASGSAGFATAGAEPIELPYLFADQFGRRAARAARRRARQRAARAAARTAEPLN